MQRYEHINGLYNDEPKEKGFTRRVAEGMADSDKSGRFEILLWALSGVMVIALAVMGFVANAQRDIADAQRDIASTVATLSESVLQMRKSGSDSFQAFKDRYYDDRQELRERLLKLEEKAQ